KYINDNFGHASGDRALKAVADALMYSSEDDEICIRMGGDEFSVIGVEYDDKKMNRFLGRFNEALKMFNEKNKYDYNIRISVGWSITQAKKDTNLEECLSVADARMYQQKKEKEEKGLRHRK
ncbi:MAG: GGDEF domain-containing protein, partial [Clostridiales bacterium]|nr:GGDEF domain-containing protein [Clostridiales bacterium]